LPEKRILIADDEPHLIRSLSFVLKKEGFTIESASDGVQALNKVKEFKPHVLFLDLQIPGMDGFEVCKRIKGDPEYADTYVIMLTAKGQNQDRDRGLAAGTNEYLTKPFSPKELVQHLRDLFGPEDLLKIEQGRTP